MIEDDHVVSNFKKNDPFILIFSKKFEEGNNNSDTDIDNFFIKVSIIFPLFSEYRKYINVFFKSEARQLSNYVLIKYIINMGDVESSYRLIYNLLINELSIFWDNLEEFLEKGYI